jgi:hypothetical protein
MKVIGLKLDDGPFKDVLRWHIDNCEHEKVSCIENRVVH